MTSEPSTGVPGDAPDPLEKANDRIRDTAKWLVASAAAVGAALLAGSQLSSIGRLQPAWPDSVEHARLWVAAAGAIAGLGAVVYAVWTAVQILLPKLVLVGELAAEWERPGRAAAPVVARFRANPKYLQGFATPQQVIDARERLIAEQRRAPAEGEPPVDRAAVRVRLADLDERITAIEDIATHEALRAQFQHTLRRLLFATGLTAAGIVAFAWAANPPARTPAADLRHARLIGAYLRDADLRDAKLDHADLTGADLTGADLTGASIRGVVWRDTTCPDGTNSDASDGTCAGHLS
ncbi:pentapeptide repeat-containing protein [Micromonospora citrea]|uniref:pentapeptide repeat-containing protein n=1 Tax=Micromonospora citrea TaxID=47855 RepID=UPI003C69080A